MRLKPSSPTNLASAIICFFASKKFPHRLKASGRREGLQRQNPSPPPADHGPMFVRFSESTTLPLVVCPRNLFGGHIGYIIGLGLSYPKNHAKIHF
ncbi:hypothetical protein HKD37_U057964 [Glycine soja]